MSISVNSAKNSVIIKDAINEAIISRFGGKLVTKKSEADTVMNVSLSSVSTSAIQYDTDSSSDTYGYANLYRTTVGISVSYKNENSLGSFSVSDSYEFAVDGSAVVSDTKKFQAIKSAASKAFDTVISSIAVRSFNYEYKYYIEKDEKNNTTKEDELKLSLYESIYNKLSTRLVEKEYADRTILLANSNIYISKIESINDFGLNYYEATISLELKYFEGNEKTITLKSIYMFNKDNDSGIGQKEKLNILNCSMPFIIEKAIFSIDKSLKNNLK